jgi:molybdopterin/thiamine biosynthesis adenylyltransferase
MKIENRFMKLKIGAQGQRPMVFVVTPQPKTNTYEVRFTQNGSDGWARTQFLNLKNANKQRTTGTTIIK